MTWWFSFCRSSFHRKLSIIIIILNIWLQSINNQTNFSENYTYYLIQSTTLVIMDKHLEWLAIPRRLCRPKKKISKGYYILKCIQDYRLEIFEIFHYDLANDSVNIHSSHVCDICRWKLEHYKKSNKKVLAIDNAPFDSHFEQNSKFKFSVSLSNISKEVTSSNSKELERVFDEITTKFVLASESNLGYYA